MFSIIGKPSYSIEAKSGNFTIDIVKAEGVEFDDDKEQNTNLIIAAIIALIILTILILRVKKIKRGKR